jgi:predicted AlkP superfamily pyrophosphatase or phosphodiesterase
MKSLFRRISRSIQGLLRTINPFPPKIASSARRSRLWPGILAASLLGALLLFGYGLLQPNFTLARAVKSGSDLAQAMPGKARLILVLVLDGLRPDAINLEDTPNLYRLRQEGSNYLNSHSVFPTVTRVNAPAIATGYYPNHHGIVSNSMYVPGVNLTQSFSTGNYTDLLKLKEVSDGKLVFVKTLAERLQEQGLNLSAVSSGSTGSALLLNPEALNGVGSLINGYFDPGKLLAFPADVNQDILTRFGEAPPRTGVANLNTVVDWTEQVLREYVLTDIKPDVILNWLTEPDGTEHAFGAGSPEALETIRNDDRNVGLILDQLKALGLEDQTDIFVVSDHGFGVDKVGVNVNQELIDAGLKASANSDDVVTASSSQTMLLHVKDRNPEQIQKVVKYLQAQEWTGVVFTAADRPGQTSQSKPGQPQGWVKGTFSLDLVHNQNAERGADIIFTFPWSSERNAFNVQGTDYTENGGTTPTAPRTGNLSGHGSMSPWTVRNTFFAWGVDFKPGVNISVPSSNVDLTPTILALKGIQPAEPLDGRVLSESFKTGPDEMKIVAKTRTYKTKADRGAYKTVLQVTEVGNQRYIDKSWRDRS